MRSGVGVMVESYIAPTDIQTETGIVIKKGTWILVTRASDELWTLWKSGEVTGYSMFGIARQVSKGETKLKKFISAIAEAIGIKKDFSETARAQIDRSAKSPWFIMDMLTEEYLGSVNWDDDDNVKLESLSLALAGAKDYVDGLIAKRIEKSEGVTEPETPTVTEPEIPETPKPAEPEIPAEPESEPEQEPELPTEPVSKSETEPADIQPILEGIVKSVQSINDKLSALESKLASQDATIDSLSKSYSVLKSIVDEQEVSSAVRDSGGKTPSKRPIVNSQPIPGEGLI